MFLSRCANIFYSLLEKYFFYHFKNDFTAWNIFLFSSFEKMLLLSKIFSRFWIFFFNFEFFFLFKKNTHLQKFFQVILTIFNKWPARVLFLIFILNLVYRRNSYDLSNSILLVAYYFYPFNKLPNLLGWLNCSLKALLCK